MRGALTSSLLPLAFPTGQLKENEQPANLNRTREPAPDYLHNILAAYQANPKTHAARAYGVQLPDVMFSLATKDPMVVEGHVQAAYLAVFPKGDLLFVPRVFSLVIECFSGRYADYQAIDANYHDFEHTLQGTLCMARLLHARHRAGVRPLLTERWFQLGIIGILLHDTGYLKRHDDTEGTGAKYTSTHVNRSAEFAAQLLAKKGFSAADIAAVQNMIRCTGVEAELGRISFSSEEEKIVGHALATADLLGQMAADDYVEKLPILYAEFAEAARHDGGHPDFAARFNGAGDLVHRTPAFWYGFVLPKLSRDFGGLHHYLNEPYPHGPNEYLRRIEANIGRILKVTIPTTVGAKPTMSNTGLTPSSQLRSTC